MVSKLFKETPEDFALRPYEQEQWDVMFFVQGTVEMLLADERAGMERRVMRLLMDGDDQKGPNNAGIVIPAGVAHALRAEGARDVIMVYGTSTVFDPAFEGRIFERSRKRAAAGGMGEVSESQKLEVKSSEAERRLFATVRG